jgi:hypothetical protein
MMMMLDTVTGEKKFRKVNYKEMYDDSRRGFFNAKEPSVDLLRYLSPVTEVSVYKGIPRRLRFHPAVRVLMITGMFRIKYRGPSKLRVGYKRPQANCHSVYADTFAIYKK